MGILLALAKTVGPAVRHRRVGQFAIVNVAVGFCIAWLLTHFLLPVWGFEASITNSTAVTLIYTVAALFRNYAIALFWIK